MQRHAGERFEERRNLRRHLRHVAGDLVHARRSAPLPVDTMVILSTLASGEASALHHFRHIADELVRRWRPGCIPDTPRL